MGRFLCGRQVLVIFSVYLASQVTADESEWEGGVSGRVKLRVHHGQADVAPFL